MEIEHGGGNALRIRADVTDAEQMAAAADRMRVHFGSIDVLVCAAGIQGPLGPFQQSALKAWIETIQTNLIGVINSVRAVLTPMIERRAGKIIVLAGGGAGNSRPNFSAYAASKAGAARFVECLADEVRDHNVQVNTMSPGGSYTVMTDEIIHAGEKVGWKEVEEAQQIRLTGGVPPDKQLQLAMFLASEESNHITGCFLHVNDDWRKLKTGNLESDMYKLRRLTR